MQKFPEVAKFRKKGLPHKHELYICFADVATTWEYAWTPASGVLPSFMQSDEDREEQPCEDIADSSPVYTTPDADMIGGEGAAGVGGRAVERLTVGG